jgi:hypothetical protein
MGKPLRLILRRVTCTTEVIGEWGKDEMYLLAFGITGGGHRLYVPPTSVGSYGTGDTNRGRFLKTLIDTTVDNREALLALHLWMFERDSGGLASSAAVLESDFNDAVSDYITLDAPMNLPAASLNFYAFAQSMVDMRFTLQVKAFGLFNSDDLLIPRFHHLRAALPQPVPGEVDSFSMQILGRGGDYQLDFDYQFDLEPVVNG